MTIEDAVKHLDNMKWLLGVNNTTVDDIPLTKVIDDIIALLKAQEPVEPTIGGDKDGQCGNWWYQCGKCKEAIDYHDKYCRNCGKAVKWGG